MDHVAEVASSFDERASQYDDSEMHHGVAQAVAEFVSLAGVNNVLDIATGTGLVLRELTKRQAGLHCAGVDISPGMLAVARRHLPDALLLQGAADCLPLADAAFDLVTIVTAMHLMSEPRSVFSEAARVLTTDGRLVLATFQLPPGRAPAQRPYRTNHRDFETPELIAAVAGPAGFQVIRSQLGQHGGDLCLLTELSLSAVHTFQGRPR